MRWSSVLFPQPLGPINATNSPGVIASETLASAVTFAPAPS